LSIPDKWSPGALPGGHQIGKTECLFSKIDQSKVERDLGTQASCQAVAEGKAKKAADRARNKERKKAKKAAKSGEEAIDTEKTDGTPIADGNQKFHLEVLLQKNKLPTIGGSMIDDLN
jgi:methionyl-tRNA synthetase